MEFVIKPLSQSQRLYPDSYIGKTICPVCKYEVFVMNGNGREGNPIFNRLENHNSGCEHPCRGSGELLINFQ